LKAQPYYFTGKTEENEDQVSEYSLSPGRMLIITSLRAALLEKILVNISHALKGILENRQAYT
jgi:hypothetical protein